MDVRVHSVMRVLNAMEELDHSELTRGNVQAASRAITSMHDDLIKNTGVDSVTDSFSKLLSMAEKGNWTDLRNSRSNGLMPNARHELDSLVRNFDKKSVTPSPAMDKPVRKGVVDRGYPPQHSAESEKQYNRKRWENELEHKDRQPMGSYSAQPPEDYDRYQLRRRDDPKQVSNQISQLASERLRGAKTVSLEDVTSPKHVADIFTDLYNREWTTAYEELNKSYRDGAETIQHLIKILENAFDFCQKTAERQIANMLMHVENEMLYPNISQQSRMALEAQVQPDRHLISLVRDSDDMIKEFRKYGATASLPVVKWLFFEEILKTIHPAQRPTNAQTAYVDRCVEVCWIMVTQNTPMHLEFCNKGDRPSSIFRPFTRMGSAVQNCVWPALFLHKDGPLLEKGVAHLG